MNKSMPDIFTKRSLTPQEEAKLEMKKINEYDYIKMLEELRFNDTLSKIKHNRLLKVKTANSIYRTNVNLMKTKVQERGRQRIRDIQSELKGKSRRVDSNKLQKSKEKEEDRLKAKTTRIQLEQTAKINVQSHSAILEEKRLEEQERTMNRLKLFNKKYNEIQSERRIVFSRKLQENEEKYQRHNQLYLMNETTEKKIKEEERLKRFTEIFWKRKETENNQKTKRQQNKSKLDRVQEMKDEKEKELKRKKARIAKKNEDMIRKKSILENERIKRLRLAIQEDQERKANVLTNREVLRREDSDFREWILLYQREAVGRSLQKDQACLLKRYAAQEDIVVNHMAQERSLSGFTIEMNLLKSESVSKKNFEERMRMYKNILRVEEEKRRKEAEDKLHKP